MAISRHVTSMPPFSILSPYVALLMLILS
jgi:hypothetical protein